MEYELLEANTPEKLAEKVSAKLFPNKELRGGIVVVHDRDEFKYYQSLTSESVWINKSGKPATGKYDILVANTPEELSTTIKSKTDDGWELQGEVFIIDTLTSLKFYQAITGIERKPVRLIV